jgi:hypothetical protein
MLSLLARKVRSALWLVRYRGGRAATRVANLTMKRGRHYESRVKRTGRIGAEKVKNLRLTAVNLARFAWRRLLGAHKPFVRRWRRYERGSQIRAERRFELSVERRVRNIAGSGRPLILGPWLSEVGFEVLYWIPFLHWLKAEYNWDPARVVAISRGGVRSWYAGLADHYVDLFDHLTPAEFTTRNQARRDAGAGSHKQLTLSPLDRDMIEHARRATGVDASSVVHPSDMYLLFRNYWLGHRPLSFVEEHTRHRRRSVPARYDVSALPRDYVAVKAYTAQSLPDTNQNRLVLRQLVERLAERTNVVTLETGLAVDDHDDYRLDHDPRVFNLGGLMTPANNLELQTQVIAGSRAFIGTCGSLTWLAPLLGVNTVALFSDARFLHPHLYFARKVYLEQQAAGFATVDVSALDVLGAPAAEAVARAANLVQ